MSKLTFKNVINNDYELEHQLPKEICDRYEELTSFNRGRNFNFEIEGYVVSFVDDFKQFLTKENELEMNQRLVNYNKLVVELRSSIMNATKIPSVMICGPAKYPTRKKEKELARIHELERELYSNDGKHARFIENTRKMFDPVLIESARKTEEMRKERSENNGWKSFYKEIDHEELAGYGIDLENNRIFVETHGKPTDEIRVLLKKSAMRWSPRNERWQRILTENAIRSINFNLFKELEIEGEWSE